MKAHPIVPAVIVLMAALGSPEAPAQQAPDAGRLLDERTPPKTLPRQRAEPVITEAPVRPAMRAAAGARFKVNRIRFAGNTVFSDTLLAPQVQAVLGTEATLAELEAAADAVARYYRERGYFVTQAYVPAQDVVAGEVEIQVREGRLGNVEVHAGEGSRIATARLEAVLAGATGPAETTPLLRQDELERAMLLMNDLPGVDAQATLMPGLRPATTTVRIDVKEGPRLSGTLGYDNQGNRYTGEHRPAATLNINDPAGIGDQLKLAYSGLQSSPYLSAAYSLPVGASGLRLAANLALTRYRLCCEYAAAGADATGHATVAGLQASYPIMRSRARNLSATLGVEHRVFVDRALGATTSDKSVRVLTLGASFDARDELLGGGLSFANLSFTDGRLNQRIATRQRAPYTDRYNKLGLFAARLQTLPAELALYAGLTAQYASTALDSSEQMSLGGANAVRAYPPNEAPGDSAALLNLELRRPLAERLQGIAFLDAGHVRNHPVGGEAVALKGYSLAGAGIALSYEQPGAFSARLTFAVPIGNNPGRAANHGKDSDGRTRAKRWWLQLQMPF